MLHHPMTHWRPSGEMSQFRREMRDLMSRFMGESHLSGISEWIPALDVSETDGHIEVKAELPGLEAKDLDVSVSGDQLTLRGEKKEDRKKEEESYFFRESYSGSFQRTVRLPAEVEGENVEAVFKNGVLHIKMPKTAKSSSQKIEVKNG